MIFSIGRWGARLSLHRLLTCGLSQGHRREVFGEQFVLLTQCGPVLRATQTSQAQHSGRGYCGSLHLQSAHCSWFCREGGTGTQGTGLTPTPNLSQRKGVGKDVPGICHHDHPGAIGTDPGHPADRAYLCQSFSNSLGVRGMSKPYSAFFISRRRRMPLPSVSVSIKFYNVRR